MAYVPMNRTHALIICNAPGLRPGARQREAARYLLDRRDAAEEERRLATEAIEWQQAGGQASAKTAKPSNSGHNREQQAGSPQGRPGERGKEGVSCGAVMRLIRLDTWPNTLRALSFRCPPPPVLSFARLHA